MSQMSMFAEVQREETAEERDERRYSLLGQAAVLEIEAAEARTDKGRDRKLAKAATLVEQAKLIPV